MAGEIRILNTQSFEKDVIKSEIPVLVDFTAKWCGPCRSMEPILEDVAREMAGKVILGKIDVDDNEELAARFGIRSVPSMLIFSNGEIVGRITGLTPKNAILDKLNSI